ncbi:type IV pilus assembly protein PilM [Patescibacteria group bacterium]|nr:type IV pilus assembly protein PilM [Patescibacteria group bacterium]
MSVGLDIGSKSVKIVELAKEKGGFRLRASGIVGFQGVTPEGAKQDKELEPLASTIKKLHKEARIASKEIVVALPESQVFTRTIKFPLLTDTEIASAVKWEAEQYIPIPLEEAVVQHQLLERREDAIPPEAIVLLVAAPKSLVEKYQKVLQLAGLTLIAAETELIAMVRSLAPNDQTVLIADFGARSTDMAIAKNGQLSFSRSIATAGEAFTRAVAQGLGIEKVQAEEYKRTYGLSGSQLEGKVKGALDPVFRLVADEMKKAIQFYQSEENKDTPKSIILSGGTAGMPEVVSFLAKLIGIEVIIGNPFSKVVVDPEAAKSLAGYSPLYSISVGLAMREG